MAADEADRIAATRAFFGPRASGWDERFPDDDASFAAAVAELRPLPGAAALDVGCGTGRALSALRASIGSAGCVIGVDVTVEMLTAAASAGRDRYARLIVADATALPLADGAVATVFAAGLLTHLRDPVAGLVELARVCRGGGRLALFHPIGRAALARRHGHELDPADVRAPARIVGVLAQTGWTCESVDDGDDRYLVVAVRTEESGGGAASPGSR